MLKEILIVFHNGSNCDYHFTIKQPAEEFTGQFACSRESTENYKTFSVPIEKELNMKTMSCRLQFVHSGFMESSWSNLILLKEFIMLNVITNMVIKNLKCVELNTKTATDFLNT